MTPRILIWLERSLIAIGCILTLWCAIVIGRMWYYKSMPIPPPTAATLPGETPTGTAGWRALVASSGSGAGDSGSGSVIGTNKNTMAGRAGRAGWPGGAGRARLLSRRTCLLPHEIRMHDEPARRVPDELERVARH